MVLCTMIASYAVEARVSAGFATGSDIKEISKVAFEEQLFLRTNKCAAVWTAEFAGRCPRGSTMLMFRRKAIPFSSCIEAGCARVGEDSAREEDEGKLIEVRDEHARGIISWLLIRCIAITSRGKRSAAARICQREMTRGS